MDTKKINDPLPKVAVLLAAYNGENYIKNQIETILNQKGCQIKIFISIDKSNDRTLEICRSYKTDEVEILPLNDNIFGSAGKNFYRLFKDSNIENFEYISLADQDDIWFSTKLQNAIEKIKSEKLDCYSSNVLAKWSNNKKTILIKKSQRLNQLDHLFESAGPGCTYVFTKKFFEEFKKHLISNWHQIQEINLHDWLIYSFARFHKYKWYIDERPSMYYMQHSNNVVGINKGLSAAKKRLKKIFSGEWFEQAYLIYTSSKRSEDRIYFMEDLKNPTPNSYLNIAKNFHLLRRKEIEKFFLLLISLTYYVKLKIFK